MEFFENPLLYFPVHLFFCYKWLIHFCLLFANHSHSESLLQLKGSVENPNNTTASKLLVVLHPSPTMVSTLPTDRTRAAIDETTRALDIEARVICFRAADLLGEQPRVVMDESEEEMEAPIIPGNLFPFLRVQLTPLPFHYVSRCLNMTSFMQLAKVLLLGHPQLQKEAQTTSF